MKINCLKCSSIAVWYYLPMINGQDSNMYYCDNCIERGCSCQIDPQTGKEDADELGRLLPCCEYDFCQDGYDE